ncbi:hypothetical protein U9M48_006080 [Paspalum notatum var. saurae]|uniref:Uncharacterized protein n=1 Tax=Paspalum notatum var. saurae TaxID=547442 RepID=A0AAQ3PRI2_PASNO
MGSEAALAPVEISSDEEGDEKMPAAGKRKSPEFDFEWLEKTLANDALGEGVDDPTAMQEFADSLMDVTGGKNNVPDVCGGGDDDDDCVILDGDPDKPAAVAKEEGFRRDGAEDELQIVAEKGELACRDFPHPRHLCATLPFSSTSHATHCNMCHCYVCDSPAPCAFWGKGTAHNDHCHATDKDARWKKLRQSSKNKSQPTPKRRTVLNFYQPSAAEPFSQRSANVNGSTGRFPVPSTVSQNQQVDPSIMDPRNIVGQRISLLRASSPMPRTTIPSFGAKSARAVPPVYTPSNVSHSQPPVPNYGLMQPPQPHAFQAAQVPPGGLVSSAGTFQNYHPQLRLNAPIGSQGQQYRPPSYPHIAPNTVVGTGVPLSRCTSVVAQGTQPGVPLSQGTSVAVQGTQYPHIPSEDTGLKEALASLARELGVSDYNTNQQIGQQSASTLHSPNPSQTLAQPAQAKTGQWVQIKKTHVTATSEMKPSSVHNSSNNASMDTVLSSGSVQIQQALPVNPQKCLTPLQVKLLELNRLCTSPNHEL